MCVCVYVDVRLFSFDLNRGNRIFRSHRHILCAHGQHIVTKADEVSLIVPFVVTPLFLFNIRQTNIDRID